MSLYNVLMEGKMDEQRRSHVFRPVEVNRSRRESSRSVSYKYQHFLCVIPLAVDIAAVKL